MGTGCADPRSPLLRGRTRSHAGFLTDSLWQSDSPGKELLAETGLGVRSEATMVVWKFLHIAAMFGAVSIFVGQGMLSAGIARTGDVRAIRRALAAEARFQPAGVFLFLLGIVLGVVTALTGDFDLTAPWLLISYGLVAVTLVVGIAYHGPRGKKLQALAEASSENELSGPLRAAINAPTARVVVAVDSLIWLAIIYMMVVKPFS